MSIFHKDCPQCAARHSITALHCTCGHCFEPERIEGTAEALALLLQEEKLYLEYLNARADQARARARAAIVALRAAKTDRDLAQQAAEAIQALRSLEGECATQAKRIEELVHADGEHDRPPSEAIRPAAQERGRSEPAAERQCPRCTARMPGSSRRCALCGLDLEEAPRSSGRWHSTAGGRSAA
jgi:hypothetical protein